MLRGGVADPRCGKRACWWLAEPRALREGELTTGNYYEEEGLMRLQWAGFPTRRAPPGTGSRDSGGTYSVAPIGRAMTETEAPASGESRR